MPKDPKFVTKRGRRTAYSLRCGHVDSMMPGMWMESELQLVYNFFEIRKRYTRPHTLWAKQMYGEQAPKTPEYLLIFISCEDLKTAHRILKMNWMQTTELIADQVNPSTRNPSIGLSWNKASLVATEQQLFAAAFYIAVQCEADKRKGRALWHESEKKIKAQKKGE